MSLEPVAYKMDSIIEDIKRFLILDWIDLEDFDSIYQSNLDSAWVDFIDSQEMGDCQSISSSIFKKFPQMIRVFGEIEVDESYVDEGGEYQNLQTHHWNVMNGEIFDFSKGTLKEFIDWEDIYDVRVFGDDWRYNSGIVYQQNENLKLDDKYTPEFICNYVNEMHSKGWERKKFDDCEWIKSHDHFILKEISLVDDNIKWSYGIHQPVILKYSNFVTELPPIVIDSDGYIIDGAHRVGVAKTNGLKTIMAYVGKKN